MYVNRAFVDFVGKTESELKEGQACGVFGCINALDDPRGCGYGPHCVSCSLRLAIEDTYKTGLGHRDIEWRSTLIGNGPQREVVLLGSTALIQAGNRSSVLLCLEDVTGLNVWRRLYGKVREQYRAVFDNAGIGIDLLDRHGRIVQVNQGIIEYARLC